MRYLRRERGPEWWIGKQAGISECVQQAGDVIFVLAGRSHYVINLWPSIATNHEMHDEARIRDKMRRTGGEYSSSIDENDDQEERNPMAGDRSWRRELSREL